jgi:primase-polymerase (primpol)-like protein
MEDSKDRPDWTEGPDEGWKGPTDDDELIRRFLAASITNPNVLFGAKKSPTNQKLWEGDEKALEAAWPVSDRKDDCPYDRSNADASLVSRVNFWTGNDFNRTWNIVLRSKLLRDKWERNKGYMPRTIRFGYSQKVYNEDHYRMEAERRRKQIEEATRIGEGSDEHLTAEKFTLEQMLARFLYVADGDRVQDLENSRDIVDFEQFVKSHRTSKMEIPIEGKVDKNGTPKTKLIEVTRVWEHSDRQQIKTVTFRPGHKARTEDPYGNAAANTWRLFDRSTPGGDPSLFVEHAKYLFGEDADRQLDWLAHIEQFPGNLPHTSWVHVSPMQGTGRNWYANVLARVWKGHVANSFNLTGMLNTGFNGRLSKKLLVIVDEINEGGSNARWENSQMLKSMVTVSEREINPKYGYPIVEWNAARWLMFSNHQSALPLDDTDRRYEVVRNDQPPKPGEYYKQLWTAINNPQFIAGVAHYLKTRNISHFDMGAHARIGEAKREMIAASRNEVDDIIAGLIEDHPADVISTGAIASMLNTLQPIGAQLTAAQRHALDRAGTTAYPSRIKTNGRPLRIRILRNHKFWKAATSVQVLAEMAKGSEAQRESIFAGKVQ